MKTPFLAAAAALLAVCISTSAHAILVDVKLSGSLTEDSRTVSDPQYIPTLTAWEFTFDMHAASVPTTMSELFAAMDPGTIGSSGTFRVFQGANLFAIKPIKIIQVVSTEFSASEGWSNPHPNILSSWAWTAIIEESVLDLKLKLNSQEGIFLSGTVELETNPAADVPDTGSTAALLGFGLLGFVVIRRRSR